MPQMDRIPVSSRGSQQRALVARRRDHLGCFRAHLGQQAAEQRGAAECHGAVEAERGGEAHLLDHRVETEGARELGRVAHAVAHRREECARLIVSQVDDGSVVASARPDLVGEGPGGREHEHDELPCRQVMQATHADAARGEAEQGHEQQPPHHERPRATTAHERYHEQRADDAEGGDDHGEELGLRAVEEQVAVHGVRVRPRRLVGETQRCREHQAAPIARPAAAHRLSRTAGGLRVGARAQPRGALRHPEGGHGEQRDRRQRA
mmetsp:Transcript_72047/g.173834  ORF Transcript_72047/g.173834 Transcript_72047/m.173834 type:complete len:265 (+) Transcript_72047:205-999(+)